MYRGWGVLLCHMVYALEGLRRWVGFLVFGFVGWEVVV